jgi:hypothetical protein
MYVYAVMSVLRLATRCRLRMSVCVNTIDTVVEGDAQDVGSLIGLVIR